MSCASPEEPSGEECVAAAPEHEWGNKPELRILTEAVIRLTLDPSQGVTTGNNPDHIGFVFRHHDSRSDPGRIEVLSGDVP